MGSVGPQVTERWTSTRSKRKHDRRSRHSRVNALLLLTLCALTAAHSSAASLLLLVVVSLSASGHVDLVRIVRLHRVDVGDCMDLHTLVVLLPLRCIQRWWQEALHLLLYFRRQLLGKLDGQIEEEVPMHERVLERRHALALDCLHEPEVLLRVRIRHYIHGFALCHFL